MKNYAIIVLILILVGGGSYLAYAKYGKTQNSSTSTNPVSEVLQKPTESLASPTATESMKVQENLVTLTANGYSPKTLTIKVGDTVTWLNKSGEMGNVSSDPHPAHTDFPALNLGRFGDGEKLTLTFTEAGTHGYHNHLNAEETGTIIVK